MPSAPETSNTARTRAARRRRLAVLAGTALALAFAAPAQARELFKPDAFANYKGNPANGEYMMNAAGCAACHAGGDDLKVLSGGLKMDTFIGNFNVPNISAHPNGIGGWSNADFLNSVMNGVGRDGRHLYPVMPYTSYAGMKPEDLLDIKAYIETLPQSDNKVEPHKLSFPYNLSATIAFWKRANFNTAPYAPDDGSQMGRGRYLVENVGACGECHTPRAIDYGLDHARAYEGEKGLTGAVAPAITRDRIAAITEGAFVKGVLMDGKKLSGAPIADPVMRKIAEGTSKLSEDDRRAMLAYLRGREVEVPPPVAVTAEAACKIDSAEATLASIGGDQALAPQADEFIGKYCRNCHGPGESAQGTFPAGDLASIAANAAFVTPGDRAKSLLYTSVSSGRMPYGKRPTANELESLGQWIDSLDDAPAQTLVAAASTHAERQRDVISWRDFVQAAVRDIGDVAESDRKFIRYFSYRNDYNGKLPCEAEDAFAKRMELYRAGFHKLLNSLSLGASLVIPETVEDTKELLVRVDIRDLDWDEDKWDHLIKKYPFGYDPDDDTVLKSLAETTGTDLPIMRIDWFMANSPKPENYHVLLELGKDIRDLEKRMGVDVDENIKRGRIIRSAVFEGASGVSDHNRMLERHDLPQGGYYWKSYDFAGSTGLQDLRRHPHGPKELEPLAEGLESFHHDGGEMIFSLPNGLQGYYLSTDKGIQLDRGPASIVSFRNRPIGKGVEVINGRSCFDCHADGIIARRDQLRDYIENTPTFTLAQRDLLLEMYVEQEALAKYMADDRNKFVAALDKIGATEKAPDGTLKSKSGPAKEEIVTWYADLYEADLDRDALAAEFDMTPEEFEGALQRVQDNKALRIGLDWLTTLKAGAKVPRFEVEQQFPALVKALMDIDPLEFDEGASTSNADPAKEDAKKEDDKKEDPKTPEYKDADYRDDAVKDDESKAEKLKLSVDIKNTDVFVDEKLTFKVTASAACELQVFYVESDYDVEILPDDMIGDTFLKAGEARTIPDAAVGELVFDEPGLNETLVLFCREGGLGDQKLDAEGARKLADSKETGERPTRGLAIKLFEKAKADEKAADAKADGNAKEGGKGTSAIHMVTFNVKARN